MNKSILLRTYVASALLCLTLFASCSADDDTALPEGKYPMTFATAMEGLTQTRATTDNTWTGNEEIAVQVGGEVKEYKPASDNPAKLTGVDADNTFYWRKIEETVSAWYSGAGYTAQLSSFSVETDQSTDEGYRKSDFLYAKPQDITYSSRTTNQLTFEHLPAKVIVHLKNGNGVTVKEVAGATVSIVSQETTSGMINADGTVVQITNSGTGAITPNVLSAPKPGFQKSVQAIVVPQRVVPGTQFIKVTIDEGTDDARDYYYTTKTDTDANLECGKQYTYDITVTKGEELKVTDQTTVSWENVPVEGSVKPAVSFNVTCPDNVNGVENFNISGVDPNPSEDKYTVNVNEVITISYAATSNLRCYLVQGIAQISTTTSGADITHIVSGIRGDLVFSFERCPEVGDYYYADGSWSSDYRTSGSAACIGIVFKVAEGTGDAASNYGSKLPNGIRGYVVALQDANENAGAWGIRGTNVNGITDEGSYVNKYDGYSNTAVVRQLTEYKNTNVNTPTANDQYWAFKVASEYNADAPTNTSGWYLPSIGQLNDIYYLPNRSALIQKAGGRDFKVGDDEVRYWSSTEKDNADAWYYRFNGDRDGAYAYAKSNNGAPSYNPYLTPSYVRAILTF